MKLTTVLFAIALNFVFVTGCGKKEEPPKPTEQQSKGMLDQAKDAAQAGKEAVTAAAAEIKDAFTTDINLDKSVADLKAEAEKMDMDALKQVAGKCKDAIVAKQSELKVASDQLAAIPMAQKLGNEAKRLTTEIQTLTEAIKPLKERFDVYLNAISDKGGDVSGLKL